MTIYCYDDDDDYYYYLLALPPLQALKPCNLAPCTGLAPVDCEWQEFRNIT